MMTSAKRRVLHDGPPRVAALDGLRAMAIASVVIFHVWPHALPGGWVGVDMFFVLSGYLITRLLDQELQRAGQIDLVAFAAKRSLRIMPALFAMLAVYVIYAQICTVDPARHMQTVAFAASFATNWARAFSSAAEGPLGHTWSLAMEEQFYLLWPLALMSLRTPNRARWIGLLIAGVVCWRAALALGGADAERTYNGFDTHTDGLLLGGLLAIVRIPDPVRAWAARWVAVPLAVITAVLLAMGYRSPAVQAVGMAVCALAAAWLLVAAQEPGRFARSLSIAPLRYLGRLSYSLYLWHLPILMLGSRHVPGGWRSTVLLLALSLTTAAASYHLIELPFLALRTRLPLGRKLPAFREPASVSSA